VTLALFDVDGTLLLTPDRVAVRAILEAVDPSLPEEAFTRVARPGQTALRQVEQLLGHAPDEGWCGRAERRYEELLGDTSSWRTPEGAAEVLAELERRGVRLTRFFPEGQGAFGCESNDRTELIELALERAGVQPADAVEIGDTPLDEQTARAAGVRSIRVDRLSSFSELLELIG